MAKIFVTRKIPDIGIQMLRNKGYEVIVSEKDRFLKKKELVKILRKGGFDGVLSLLTDKIDGEIFEAAPSVKIFANYAVGFDNMDVSEAKKRGIVVTNTPGDLTDVVAEHTFGLILTLVRRIVEGDNFIRAGKYKGWAPLVLMGDELKGKTLGLIGAGRIGGRVAYAARRGFDMRVIYFDVIRNEKIEKECGAEFRASPEEVLREADIVSIHVPLSDSTRHFINRERLSLMKKTAYLVNTSRGAVIDEEALVRVLQSGGIRGAGLDVFEFEPKLAKGLAELKNTVLTPHIASASERARNEMARIAAENLIAFFDGKNPPNAL